MNKKAKEFIKYVKDECKKYGIKCDLRRTKYVRLPGKLKCSGYFDDQDMELVCSMNRPASLEILAHEFGHFTQWIDQTDLWKKADISIPKVDMWLMGEVMEVQDDFELLTWDLVSNPSNPDSWMKNGALNESRTTYLDQYARTNSIITEILCAKGTCPIF